MLELNIMFQKTMMILVSLLVLSSMLQIEDGLIIYQDLGTSYVLLMYKVMLISLQNDLKMDINGIFYLIVIIKGMNICTIGFGLPSDQTPTGPVTFTIINRDGSSTSTGGVGFGSGAPLPQFWRSAGAINYA